MKLSLDNNKDRILGKILQTQAALTPEARYLITDQVTVTFGEADEQTNRLAAGLAELGVSRGERVVLLLSSRPEMVLLTLAVNKLAGVWVPINTDFRGEWLLDAINGSRPTVIVTEEQFVPRLTEIEGKLPEAQVVVLGTAGAGDTLDSSISYDDLLAHQPIVPDFSTQGYGDTCAILWTSGTTGKSKGVMQSHNNWIRAIVNGASVAYDSQEDDVCYCPLPLYNSGAWITCVYRALIEGIPCVLENKFSVSQFWERINHFGATQTFAIGAMGSFLMASPESPQDRNNTLRRAYIVPMAPDMWKPFEQRFDMELVSSGLGMSECLMIMNHNDCDESVPSYALGLPPADLEVKLCDDAGQEVEPGTPGEICLKPKAPHVIFKAYFDNPEAMTSSFRGDWFLTGDMARLDPESGAYFFADRKKDAVRFAGRNISTLEVESVVRRNPGVADVAAYGIPVQGMEAEDELKLSVIRKPGVMLTAEELCTFINENAPYFFVPRYLDFVDSLPYTPTQKVQKFQLRNAGNTDSTWDLRASDFQVRR